MTLSHAEALAAITLTSLPARGAGLLWHLHLECRYEIRRFRPSGRRTFPRPLVAGQLARLIDLPSRCASGSAANINDSQAANETQFALWGCLMAGPPS